MYELKVLTNFSSAHYLRNFNGKCESLHGHNWRVEIWVAAMELDEIGLVLDFGVIKSFANEIMDQIDHKCLNDLSPFKEKNPTSENIAYYIYEQIKQKLDDNRIKVTRIGVWESDTSCAFYQPTIHALYKE